MHFRLRNVLAMIRKEGRTMLHDHALLAAILAWILWGAAGLLVWRSLRP